MLLPSLFSPVNCLSCIFHCRIKSQPINLPETSLHALGCTSRGQETSQYIDVKVSMNFHRL
jgi:hypothetical protein